MAFQVEIDCSKRRMTSEFRLLSPHWLRMTVLILQTLPPLEAPPLCFKMSISVINRSLQALHPHSLVSTANLSNSWYHTSRHYHVPFNVVLDLNSMTFICALLNCAILAWNFLSSNILLLDYNFFFSSFTPVIYTRDTSRPPVSFSFIFPIYQIPLFASCFLSFSTPNPTI